MKIPYTELKSRIIKKDELDPRRHKKHCIYFSNDECTRNYGKCPGSSLCLQYKSKYSEFKQSASSFNKENDYAVCNDIKLSKKRNCTLILHIDKFRNNQIEVILAKYDSYPLKATLRNAEKLLPKLDKLNITRINLEFDDQFKRCFIPDNKIQVNTKKIGKSKNIIITAEVVSLINTNTTISKKSKRIWYELDPLIGNIEIVLNSSKNRKKSKKRACKEPVSL